MERCQIPLAFYFLFLCVAQQAAVAVDSQCESGPDIAFILDGSGSIGHFYWDIQIFVEAVTEKILMKCTKLNAAIVLFGDEATVVRDFSQKFSLSEFLWALHGAVPVPHSRTMTHKALRVTSEKVFPFSRKNASKIAILITDGIQTPPHNPFQAAQKLKEQGVRLFAFGIGIFVSPMQLKRLTEREEDVILADGFFNLFSLVNFLVRKVITAVDNPSIRMAEDSVQLFVGRKAVIFCNVTGWPPPTVKWLMNGMELKNGFLNISVSLKEGKKAESINSSLHFSEVDVRHAGFFSCEAENKYLTKKRNIQVLVTCPPTVPELTVRDRQVKSGLSNATLRCHANGLDYNKLLFYHWQWIFQGHKIRKNDKYSITNDIRPPNFCQHSKGSTTLGITNTSKENLGQYVCELLLANISVVVKDILLVDFTTLSPPKIQKWESTDCGSAIRVKWSAPATEPKTNVIFGYEFTLRSTDERSRWKANVSREIVSRKFVGLQMNTDYEFNIRAKYSNSSSSVSPWTKVLLKTTSDIPDAFDIKAVPYGCSAKLSWNAPSPNGCPISRYTIHYRDETSGWNTINLKWSNVNDYRIWLNCSKNYHIMVFAWNQRGHNHYTEKSVLSLRTENGVPFIPSIKKIERKQCGIKEVSWEASSSESGGGSVTEFQVQMEQGGDWRNCSRFLPNNTCSFHGLLIDKSDPLMNVRVRAFNRKGFSDWTNTSISLSHEGPPDPPEIKSNVSSVSDRNVTVTWRRPKHYNCNITVYSIHFRVIEPLMGSWSEINISEVTSYQLQLQYSKQYEFIIAAWNKLGRSENSIAWKVRTAQDVPYKPTLHPPISEQCNSINVTWSPPIPGALGDPVIGYVAQIAVADPKEEWINCSLYGTFRPRTCLFTHLEKFTMYRVRVFAKNKLGYSLPSIAKEIFTKQADRPGSPEIVERKVSGCNVTLEWTSPKSTGCPILFYTISYRKKGLDDDNTWTYVNVTDEGAKQTELILNCSTTYEFQARAWNELGGGDLSSLQSATTNDLTTSQHEARESHLTDSPPLELVNLIALIVAGVVVLVALLLIITVWHYYKKRASKQVKRTVDDIHVLEQCEIHPLRTEFIEALGEGAFGKVHKATLKDGLDYLKNGDDLIGKAKRKKIVAIKELHENAGEEQRRQFLDEIDLMRQVGQHRNILSFLGCWTTTEPFLLIIEYVAHGDLLQWLRSKRTQINSSADSKPKENDLYAGSRTALFGPTFDQTNEESDGSGEIPEDVPGPGEVPGQPGIDECKIPLVVFSTSEEGTDGTSGKTNDECSVDCESFIPADLLSFAWQIAGGMSYLSGKGLVHRDLAARNVLVGHGKRLKIADFGLMREVYHEVYEVQKQKKLPVKWMAPESLYEQIFTSKSDVWSYGVVLWEIATVGGSPYPLLTNAELMRLLKTGHRMEKPELCSDHVYSLMLDCWKKDLNERPSFQELVGRLEELMHQEVEYFDFDKVDESKDYYLVQEVKTNEDDLDGVDVL